MERVNTIKMKTIYTLAFALIVSASAVAQTKPDTTKRYTVTIPLADYQTLVQHMAQSKSWIPYTDMPDKDKVQFQKQIDAYLKELPNRARVDSLKGGKK